MSWLHGENRRTRRTRSILRFPLLYKLLVANVAIVAMGVATGTVLTVQLFRTGSAQSTVEFVVAFVLVAVGVSALANLVVLRLALSPLKRLEQAAARVDEGDLAVRALESPLADAEMSQLIKAFNNALSNLASYRRRVDAAATAALDSVEAERERIARELHDETASSLTALLLHLRVARQSQDPETRNEHFSLIRDGLSGAIEGIHRIVRALRPAQLEEMGLTQAIKAHAREVESSSHIHLDLDVEFVDDLLSRESELALYRIVQEALVNAVQHGHPEHVRVKIERTPNTIVAIVSDDGRGFASHEGLSASHHGTGLIGMRERAAKVDGELKVDSRPGEGTVVRLEILYREPGLG